MKQMHITETVLRDAQQSLIATRMPFEDFEGILDEMDQAGYHSIECWGGATFAQDQISYEEHQAADAAARSEPARLSPLFG